MIIFMINVANVANNNNDIWSSPTVEMENRAKRRPNVNTPLSISGQSNESSNRNQWDLQNAK